MFSHSRFLPPLLRRIDRADRAQIDVILDHAMARYQALYPEYEMVYLALPKEDSPQRKAEVAKVKAFLNRHPLD